MTATGPSLLERGLSRQDAERRLAQFGPNALPDPPQVPRWQRWLEQFKSPLMYILLFALILDLSLWLWQGAERWPVELISIGLILLLNAGLGVYQEGKAEQALARLKALAAPSVWVIRGGVLVEVPARNLVPGDIARIEAGDRVPADGTLAFGQGVATDELIITGESLPVDKDRGQELLCGTLIVRGKGYIEVSRTGVASTMGRIATMIGGIEMGKTPLERRLGEFGTQVALAILALGLLLTIAGVVIEGIGRLGQVFLFSVALAVAAVPEGLPAVLTLTLALGVERLAGRKAIVRRLSAVEALGSVTVIATDKTGTLTENRMHVRSVDAVDAAGALQAMVLANDAEIGTRAGDPIDLALIDYAAGQGVDPHRLISSLPRVTSAPFDSRSRFMAVTVDDGGRRTAYFKGAPEVLIARSTLKDADKRIWEARAASYAASGHRVLALAWQPEEDDEAVAFLGLILLWDPPRPEVPDALRRAAAAGIRVLMITGDHPATAEAVGRAIGITTGRVLTGADMDRLSDEELRDAISTVNVFARVSPEHKLRLIDTLKDLNEIVAVTGDGVNDAPALKRSDVGVAMGRRGSDVAREVSDVVLMDDNFATIVAAIEEGRNIYENIQKFHPLLLLHGPGADPSHVRGPRVGLPARPQGPGGGHIPAAAHRCAASVDQFRGRWTAGAGNGARPQPRCHGTASSSSESQTPRRGLAPLPGCERCGQGFHRPCDHRRPSSARPFPGGDADDTVRLRIRAAAGVRLSFAQDRGSRGCQCVGSSRRMARCGPPDPHDPDCTATRTARPGSPRRRNSGRRHAGYAAHLGPRRVDMPMDD